MVFMYCGNINFYIKPAFKTIPLEIMVWESIFNNNNIYIKNQNTIEKEGVIQ